MRGRRTGAPTDTSPKRKRGLMFPSLALRASIASLWLPLFDEQAAGEGDGESQQPQQYQPSGGVFIEKAADGPQAALEEGLAPQRPALLAQVLLVLVQHLLAGVPVA